MTPITEIVCCPRCKSRLAATTATLTCTKTACGRTFPFPSGRPVLIDEERSVFSVSSFGSVPALDAPGESGLVARFRAWTRRLPSPSINLSARRCFEQMKQRLLARGDSAIVLIVGGGVRGKGMDVFAKTPAMRLINVDSSPESDAVVFCDAHDLPFPDASVDAVVTQALLEHVADPVRCVEEIERVLKPEGLIYSEIPFMQQVHMQGYDFTRFTHLGHRRLLRRFREVESGAVAGPGTALAWSWRYFLSALTDWLPAQRFFFWLGRVTGILIEQTDYLFLQRPAALDGASCIYFLGEKSDQPASDRELVKAYRGAQR